MKLTISLKMSDDEAKRFEARKASVDDSIMDSLGDELYDRNAEVLEIKDGYATVKIPVDRTSAVNVVGSKVWERLADISGIVDYGYDVTYDYDHHLPCLFKEDNMKVTQHQAGGQTITFSEEYSV